jgi:hypothetical protein
MTFRPARASRQWPTRERRVVTPRDCGQSGHHGELAVGSMMVETQRFLRAISHWTSAYKPLQEHLGGESRKVVLTGGVDGAVEEDGIDGENSAAVEEGVPILTPQLCKRT